MFFEALSAFALGEAPVVNARRVAIRLRRASIKSDDVVVDGAGGDGYSVTTGLAALVVKACCNSSLRSNLFLGD